MSDGIASKIEHIEEKLFIDEQSAEQHPGRRLIPLLPVYVATSEKNVVLRNLVDYFSPEYPKRLMGELQRFRENGWFSDDKVFLTHEVRVHRLVLMASSKYLERALGGDCKSSRIDAGDVPKDVVDKLIDYIYTGKITFSSQEPEIFLKGADFFQLNYLTEQYFKFLVRHASRSDLCTILNLLHIYLPHNEEIKRQMEKRLES